MSDHPTGRIMDRDVAQENIDQILERPGYRSTEWAVWCSNPIWTHCHDSTPFDRESADKMLAREEAKGCHYGPAQFFLLEHDVTYGEWRQP